MPARPTRGVYAAAALALSVAVAAPAAASVGHHDHDRGHDSGSFTYAVYGDAPYGTTPTDTSETDATPAFIRAVNADKAVSTVLHVGDIHSGSQYCTQAYDQQIADLWAGFADPLVYTPGDNEWTDCHKKKEGGGAYNPATGQIDYVKDADGNLVDYAGGNPVDNLALVRSIFFATARRHAGQRSAARPLPGAGRQPRAPHGRAVRRERDVGARRRPVRHRQRARRLQQRRRPLVRRADAPRRSRPPRPRTAPAPTCAGSTARSAPPAVTHARSVVVIDPGGHVGPRRQGRSVTWRTTSRSSSSLASPRPRLRQAGAAAQRRLARLPLRQPAAAGVVVHR